MTLTIGLVIVIVAVSTGLLLLLPKMAKPTVPFGVRVPEERTGDTVVLRATRQYYSGVVVTMAVVTAALAALALVVPQTVIVLAASIVPFAAWLVPYLSARRLILTAKRDGGWFDDVPQAVATDTTWRTSPPPYPWTWAVPAILVAMATLVVGIVRYPSLPDRIAVHIGTGGPDRFADTTVESAFGLVAVEIALTAVLMSTALLALRTRPEISAASPRESAEQYRRYAITMAKLVLVLAAGMNLTFLIAALMVWDVVPPDLTWGVAGTLPTLAATVILVVAAVRAGQSGHRIRTDAAAEPGTASAKSSDRDDDVHWIGGLFYYNREDPAVWVPKRYGGIGWTINFARPVAWMFTVAFLAVTTGAVVWAITAESGTDPETSPSPPATQEVVGAVDLTPLDGTPVGDRLDWVLTALASDVPPTEDELEEAFDPTMLSQASVADLRAAFRQFAADYEVTALHSTTPTTLVAEIDGGAGQRWQLQLAVTEDTADPRITGLLFQPPLAETATFASWDEVGDVLAGLADEVGYFAAEVDGTACAPIAALDEHVRAPLGSVFKLYVLGAVADAVSAGDLSWDDELTIEDDLKSLPSGTLQDAEPGTTVTVAEAAKLMISISDNTATDHLVALVGREAVERAQAGYGHGAPEVNRPFLTTREMFQLKWQVDDAVRADYVEAGEAGRRAVLAALADRPLEITSPDITTPVATDTLEWFASPSELCSALARLDATEQEPVRTALGANPIVRLEPSAWSRTAAKGGSEPGVLSFAWLLERASDGRTFAFAITLHDDAAIDQNAVLPAVEGAISLLSE